MGGQGSITMDLHVGDIVVYEIKNLTSCTMLLLEHMESLTFGDKFLVLDLETGATLTWIFYPIDKMYIKKVI